MRQQMFTITANPPYKNSKIGVFPLPLYKGAQPPRNSENS
jgi:hypothetical protein